MNVNKAFAFINGLIYVKIQESLFLKNITITFVTSLIYSLFYIKMSYSLVCENMIVQTFIPFFKAEVLRLVYLENDAAFLNIKFFEIEGTVILLESDQNATVSFQNQSAYIVFGSFLYSISNLDIQLMNIYLNRVNYTVFVVDWYYQKNFFIQNLTIISSTVKSIFVMGSINYELYDLNFTNIQCGNSCFIFVQTNVSFKNLFIKLNENPIISRPLFFNHKTIIKIENMKLDKGKWNFSNNYLLQFNQSMIVLSEIFIKDIKNSQDFLFLCIDSYIKYDFNFFIILL
jgi:hypothetical protein